VILSREIRWSFPGEDLIKDPLFSKLDCCEAGRNAATAEVEKSKPTAFRNP